MVSGGVVGVGEAPIVTFEVVGFRAPSTVHGVAVTLGSLTLGNCSDTQVAQ